MAMNGIPKIELPEGHSNTSSKETSPSRPVRLLSATESKQNARAVSPDRSPTRAALSSPSTDQPTIASRDANRSNISRGALAAQLDGPVNVTKQRIQKSDPSLPSSPSWPTSPRLKSPPPSGSRRIQTKRAETEHPPSNTSIKRLAPVTNSESGAVAKVTEADLTPSHTGNALRPPGRASNAQVRGLETVDESSTPTTPALGPMPNPLDLSSSEANPTLPRPDALTDTSNAREDIAPSMGVSSGQDIDKPEMSSISGPSSRASSNTKASQGLAQRSFTSLRGAKGKPAVEPVRQMTVETETVNPTSQLLTDRTREGGGSVRAKPSTETIRPKKERRKLARKPPSLHSGTGTSKADIFEAKVASAVDEADSSDSDETFVYESNPPEPRQNRHHSRTPSTASVTSIDPYRGKHGVRGGGPAITGKKSMKFSSGAHGNHLDQEGSGGDGRSKPRNGHSTSRHHHIGRHGRNGHLSIVDTDSPFSPADKGDTPRSPNPSGAHRSRPNSPQAPNGRLNNTVRKGPFAGYDTYDDGADDERVPLMTSVRANRSRHVRRPNHHHRGPEFDEVSSPGCWSRFGGCILLVVLVILVVIGVTTFVVALNRPLLNVEVKHVQNVLASEQELMVDLQVKAINPNLFSVGVNDLDVNLFAQSPYAGTAEEWQRQHSTSRPRKVRRSKLVESTGSWFPFPPFHPDDGVDEGNDPIDDPEPGTQKLLLGRIFEFDSPLVFDPSPIRHTAVTSVGEIRLAKPANQTEVGGSARWERVLQHPFDLIVRGVMKYQLPLSARTRSAKIDGRIRVAPNSDGGDDGSNSTVVWRKSSR